MTARGGRGGGRGGGRECPHACAPGEWTSGERGTEQLREGALTAWLTLWVGPVRSHCAHSLRSSCGQTAHPRPHSGHTAGPGRGPTWPGSTLGLDCGGHTFLLLLSPPHRVLPSAWTTDFWRVCRACGRPDGPIPSALPPGKKAMQSSTFQSKVFLLLLAERFSENLAHQLLEEGKAGR